MAFRPVRGFRERKVYPAVCTECGKECEVPFKPTEGRPVYCKECWDKRRGLAKV